MRIGPLIVALVMFLVVGWMLWEAGDFTEEAQRMPVVIAVPTLGLLAVQLVREGVGLRSGGGAPEGESTAGEENDGDEERSGDSTQRSETHPAWTFVAVLGMAAAFWVLGLLVAVPLFIALFTWLYGHERWWVVVLMAVGTWAVVYFFFVVLLELPIYDGLLWDAFG